VTVGTDLTKASLAMPLGGRGGFAAATVFTRLRLRIGR
jgi:hypothetical protein